jgi:hypothetical protein
MVGWVISTMKHDECQTRLIDSMASPEEPTDQMIRLKEYRQNRLVIPSPFSFYLGLNINTFFNENFEKVLHKSSKLIRKTISSRIQYDEEFATHICKDCFDFFKNKLVNGFISGKVKNIRNETYIRLKEKYGKKNRGRYATLS